VEPSKEAHVEFPQMGLVIDTEDAELESSICVDCPPVSTKGQQG
jgi:hypothetical protein